MSYVVVAGRENLGQLPKWDLEGIFYGTDEPHLERDIEFLLCDSQSFQAVSKGHLADLNSVEFAMAITEYEKLKGRQNNLEAYGDAHWTLDTAGQKDFREKIQNAVIEIGEGLAFFSQEIAAMPQEKIDAFLQDQDVQKYQFWIEKTRLYLPYQVTLEQEVILSGQSKEINALVKNHTDIIGSFKYNADGNTYTIAQLKVMSQGTDPAERALSEVGINQFLDVNGKDLFDLYHQATTLRAAQLKQRNYPDATAKTFLDNDVKAETIQAMFAAINTAAPETLHRFMAWRAQQLGYADSVMPSCDMLAPLPGMPQTAIPFEMAEIVILRSFRNFSPDAAEIIEGFFDESRTRIDARPLPGRRGINSCIPRAPDDPLVFTNYRGRAVDVRDLAHELGHGVHHSFAAALGILGATIPAVIKETASIFSELLILEAMLEATPESSEKIAMIADAVLAPVFLNTAVMSGRFQFESALYEAEAKGELTAEFAAQQYLLCQQNTYGPAVSFGDGPRHEWLVGPTFMPSPFNTYPYTVGFMFSAALFGLYQECPNDAAKQEFADKFIEALKAGGTKSINELAADFGFDLNQPAFWEKGMNYLRKLIGRLPMQNAEMAHEILVDVSDRPPEGGPPGGGGF